jgi:hypothetical protein
MGVQLKIGTTTMGVRVFVDTNVLLRAFLTEMDFRLQRSLSRSTL